MSLKTDKPEIIYEKKENSESICMLFDISREVKYFYETPVIFVTRNDFSDKAFHFMCSVHEILDKEKTDKNKAIICDLIIDYHLQWLQCVNDIEDFQDRILNRNIPRQEMIQLINFTIESMGYRLKYYQRYIEKHREKLTNENHTVVNAELEIVEEMDKEVNRILLEKSKCFLGIQSDAEFDVKLKSEIEDLLQWLDTMSDNIAVLLSKYVSFNIPNLNDQLANTLQHIVKEYKSNESPPVLKLLEKLKREGKDLLFMIRTRASHDLEIDTIEKKIAYLDQRIELFESENSHAVINALRNKKEYLQDRLASLDSIKTTLRGFHNSKDYLLIDVPIDDVCICEDFYQMRIFNHDLPSPDREKLISDLCYLWDMAVCGTKDKSMISILSAANVREEFTDELGTFFIDEYNRKIYKKDDEPTLYQCNEKDKLVPLSDDSEHIYFYDDCGRYFNDPKTRQKIYKADATASEYMMDTAGVLLKVKEIRNGHTFYYDNYGRYYINAEDKRIYQEEDAISEYENDGFGNLVRIRSHADIFEPCPEDENVTEDFNYLKQNIGAALRECIAETIVRQPADPIKYLSLRLIRYRDNIEQREKKTREKEQLDVEREIRAAEEREALARAAREAAELLAQGGSEASYDSNLVHYMHAQPAETNSASSPR